KRGLLAFDGASLRAFHSSFEGLHITALAGDETDLWVGTLDRGVFNFRSGQADRFGEAEGLPDPQVLTIVEHQGAVYVGTPTGVAEFTGGKLARRLGEGMFARSLAMTSQQLMIGTLDEGVWQVPLKAGGRASLRATNRRLLGAVQRIISFDPSEGANGQDATLYAVALDGLYRLNARGYSRVVGREDALLADRNISALAIDEAGRLLVGYFDRGIDLVEPDFRHVRHLEDEHIFC